MIVIFDSLAGGAKAKTLTDEASKLLFQIRNILSDEGSPWHSDERVEIKIAKQWARQQDPYNCGPLALKAAELSTQIDLSALSKDPKAITEQKAFQDFLVFDDAGTVARSDVQYNVEEWVRLNPLPKLEQTTSSLS